MRCVVHSKRWWVGLGVRYLLVALLPFGGGLVGWWFTLVVYPTSGVKNRKNSFRILSARFILVKGEGKIRDARGSEMSG